MTTHDWIAIGLSVFSAIVVPAIGIAFVSKMTAIESGFSDAIREMEDRVVEFIRRHEQDGFAHPNLEIIRLLTTKLDAITESITGLTVMIERHIAKDEK